MTWSNKINNSIQILLRQVSVGVSLECSAGFLGAVCSQLQFIIISIFLTSLSIRACYGNILFLLLPFFLSPGISASSLRWVFPTLPLFPGAPFLAYAIILCSKDRAAISQLYFFPLKSFFIPVCFSKSFQNNSSQRALSTCL